MAIFFWRLLPPATNPSARMKMPKQIHPAELAELVGALLTDPASLNELHESHECFIEAIGAVVADYCGGEIAGVVKAQTGGKWLDSPPILEVNPSAALPSLSDCVWSIYDPGAWHGEGVVHEYAEGDPLCPECGCPVSRPSVSGTQEWVGSCPEGHVRAYRMFALGELA